MLFATLVENEKRTQPQNSSAEAEVDMSKYKNDPKYACTYMEIPQQDINKAERDFGLFGPTEAQTPPEKDTGK